MPPPSFKCLLCFPRLFPLGWRPQSSTTFLDSTRTAKQLTTSCIFVDCLLLKNPRQAVLESATWFVYSLLIQSQNGLPLKNHQRFPKIHEATHGPKSSQVAQVRDFLAGAVHPCNVGDHAGCPSRRGPRGIEANAGDFKRWSAKNRMRRASKTLVLERWDDDPHIQIIPNYRLWPVIIWKHKHAMSWWRNTCWFDGRISVHEQKVSEVELGCWNQFEPNTTLEINPKNFFTSIVDTSGNLTCQSENPSLKKLVKEYFVQ